jgi:hypothetical protein
MPFLVCSSSYFLLLLLSPSSLSPASPCSVSLLVSFHDPRQNAYLLMYRLIDSSRNLNEVSVDAIPKERVEEVKEDNEEYAKAKKVCSLVPLLSWFSCYPFSPSFFLLSLSAAGMGATQEHDDSVYALQRQNLQDRYRPGPDCR